MNFEEGLLDLSAKVRNQSENIQTEEATKNAFIMPFISRVLGYDVFNPSEVVPEFTADHGTKKGEKVDYAIKKDGVVQLLIECKRIGDEVNVKHASQLFRYFSVTRARIAILTNGRLYHFYTDLDSPNIMDARPFMMLDLLDIDESIFPELMKMTKETFDLTSIINSAEELKYVGALKREIAAEFREPTTEWVKSLMSRVSGRRGTAENLRQFTELTEKAVKQFLKEQVNDRLKVALGDNDFPVGSAAAPVSAEADPADEAPVETESTEDRGIETTQEELDGFALVKAIACSEVRPQRITARDSKSYFAVLLDDNNRKTVARLHFNAKSKRYLGLLDENKTETRYELSDVEDIYQHADAIRSIVQRLDA